MKKLCIAFCLASSVLVSQTIDDCRHRFEKYLNFRGSIAHSMRFEKDVMYLLSPGGKAELAIFENEIPLMASIFRSNDVILQEKVMKQKGLKKFSQGKIDSLGKVLAPESKTNRAKEDLPLKGYRVAIDPGHFATSLGEALVEKKYLYFLPAGFSSEDSVKIFESYLTFNTASLLEAMLEAQGATVFVTREKNNFTSFNCTYSEWNAKFKRKTLDSLLQAGTLTLAKYRNLLKLGDTEFFWDFFRDYDLANRARKINEFRPHATLIIHYNVDEKNAPWDKHTTKNFSMAFIPGAFTSDNLTRKEGKINFLRLLLCDHLNRSEVLAGETVANFHKYLDIPIATPADALYLKNSCLNTSCAGVYCRNLALCRRVNSPLVYGESLYQDNEKESSSLMKSDIELFGIKTNERVNRVAISYYEAVTKFLTQD